MKEKWVEIHGLEGRYCISDYGRVKSLDCKIITASGSRNIKGRILRPNIGTNGYYYVSIGGKTRYVHRLVGEHFIINNKILHELDHIDENKLNNRAVNLRWLDHFTNASRSTKGKYRRSSAFLENNPRAKKVYCYDNENLVRIFGCAKEITNIFNINYSTLRYKLQNDILFIHDLKYSYNYEKSRI